MLMTTTDTLDRPFTPLGLVLGSGLAGIGGLNSQKGTQRARAEAEQAMQAEARTLGADAIIGIHLTALTPTNLVLAGTAVKFTGVPA